MTPQHLQLLNNYYNNLLIQTTLLYFCYCQRNRNRLFIF